jgi:hypothetical protein
MHTTLGMMVAAALVAFAPALHDSSSHLSPAVVHAQLSATAVTTGTFSGSQKSGSDGGYHYALVSVDGTPGKITVTKVTVGHDLLKEPDDYTVTYLPDGQALIDFGHDPVGNKQDVTISGSTANSGTYTASVDIY